MQQRIYRHHPERYRSENMATFVNTFNLFLFFVFSLCYMYQAVYAVIVLVKDHRRKITHVQDEPLHKFAVMIAGRNEEAVIGELVRSIKNQDYPEELIDVFVIADNCTDNTAQVAEEAGAEVLVRNDRLVVGKSHALDFALNRIRVLYGDCSGRTDYDAYFVFDADNVLDPGFVSAMNRGVNRGYQVLTCYRNSKNYDSNWISAGSALWFLREAKFLSNARYMMGSSWRDQRYGFHDQRGHPRIQRRLDPPSAHRGHRVLDGLHRAWHSYRLLRRCLRL